MSRDGYPDLELRRTADILFTATIRAEELRFVTAPESLVEFAGDAADESTSGSMRTNLPDEVKANVTYRDIRIDAAIAAKMRRHEE